MSLTPADLLAAYAIVRAAADRWGQPHLHALADRLLAEHARLTPDPTPDTTREDQS